MKHLSKIYLAGAAALALAGSARASTYELSFAGSLGAGDVFITTSGSNVTQASGWLADSDLGAGHFAVTGLSPYASADNTFSPNSPYLTLGGLSFATAAGNFNLANMEGYLGYHGYGLLSSVLDPDGSGVAHPIESIALTVTAVPEPGSLALMMAGALGLFGMTRRRAVR